MTTECVQCGYCCTVRACFAGKYDFKNKRCKFLTKDNLCGIYNEIIEKYGIEGSPAFGAGCSSTLFNTQREKTIREKNVR